MAGPNTNFPKVFTMTLLLVGMIGISSALTVSKAATTTIKIMPCGDSVTAGIGDPNMGAYRTELYNLYKNAGLTVDFVGSQRGGPSTLPEREHEGHSGWTIPQVASNVNNWLNTYNPDAMLLWIGGNDILQRGQPNPTGLSNLIDQITTAKPNLKLFVANYYHLPTNNAAYAQQEKYITQVPEIVSAKQAAGKKVYFVKLSEANLASSDIASDNLHLSPAGYQKIAQIWYKYTVSALNPTVTSSPITSPSPTPSVSKSPTPTVHPTPSATATSSFAVAYTLNDWGGGANVSITIKNNGSQAVNGWSLEWAFPGNQKISTMWNATYTQSGASVTVKNQSYNSTLPAGGSVTFGFNLTYSGSNAKPTGFRLNGTPCATID